MTIQEFLPWGDFRRQAARCSLRGMIGTTELLIVAFIALLIFGARLPKVARSLGQAKSEFKRGLDEGANDESPKASD